MVCMSLPVIFQVALSVAAEFWEQGDLERTVLEQQPIVSLSIAFYICFPGQKKYPEMEVRKLPAILFWVPLLPTP